MRTCRVLPVLAVVLVVVGATACSGDDGEPTMAPATTSASSGAVAPGVEPTGRTEAGEVVTADGRTRTWRTYIPAARPGGPMPLLLVLHGGLGSGEQVRTSTGYDALAEANGFVVGYPDGIGGTLGGDDLRTWNAGDCCGPAERDQVDDVAFLRTVIEQTAHEHDIDPTRILVVGHSNGGMMALRLACEAADLVTGVGAVGSSLEVGRCAPSRPVSVALVHGLDDLQHPYEGGTGERSVSRESFRPARDGVEHLAAAAGCETNVEETDGDLTVTTWSGCDDGTEVRLTTIAGASHAWPGGEAGAELLVGAPYAAYDASAELYGFLVGHPRR